MSLCPCGGQLLAVRVGIDVQRRTRSRRTRSHRRTTSQNAVQIARDIHLQNVSQDVSVPDSRTFHTRGATRHTGNGCSAQRVLLGRSMPGLPIVLLELVHVLDLDVADVRKLVVGMQP